MEIIISGEIRKIDLLFYHIYLRCYVVLELKVKQFDSEFAGKLYFYVNAVNEFIRRTLRNDFQKDLEIKLNDYTRESAEGKTGGTLLYLPAREFFPVWMINMAEILNPHVFIYSDHLNAIIQALVKKKRQ